MKNKFAFFLLIILIFSFVGCNESNNYRSAAMQFRDSYMKATDFLELDNDWFKALDKMDPDLVELELQKMNDALIIMNNETKTDDEKKLYGYLKSDYEDLKYILSVKTSIPRFKSGCRLQS